MIDRLALILLLTGCVLLAAIVFSEVTSAPAPLSEGAAVPAPRPETASAAARPEAEAQYGAMVAAILARPLFSASRRPPVHGDGPAADTTFADTRLAGIVTEPGRRFAIFAPTGTKPLIVREGDTVSGWRVETITPHEVSLSGPGGNKTLQPKIDPNLAPPAPPPVAAAGSPPIPPLNPAVVRPPLPPVNPAAVRPPLPPGGLPALMNRATRRPGVRER